MDEESQQIVQRVATCNATVLFTRDLKLQDHDASSDGGGTSGFSAAIQQEGLQAIQRMIDETENFKPDQTAAVATEAFRKAANGPQFAELVARTCDLPVTIATSQQEADFGFQTAAAVSGIDAADLVSWDCGAGSFQLNTLDCGSHVDSHGSGTVAALAQPLRDSGMSPQSVAQELMSSLTESLTPVPPTVAEAIEMHTVVAIGSQHSMFNQQRILSGKSEFSQRDVERSIEEVVALHPTQLPGLEMERSRQYGDVDDQDEIRCHENATYMVPKLVLLLAVMRHAGIHHATFLKTNGNCEGLVAHPLLWDK